MVEEKGAFNFSRLINIGATAANGDFLALLNDDVVPENAEWLGEMVSQLFQRGWARLVRVFAIPTADYNMVAISIAPFCSRIFRL